VLLLVHLCQNYEHNYFNRFHVTERANFIQSIVIVIRSPATCVHLTNATMYQRWMKSTWWIQWQHRQLKTVVYRILLRKHMNLCIKIYVELRWSANTIPISRDTKYDTTSLLSVDYQRQAVQVPGQKHVMKHSTFLTFKRPRSRRWSPRFIPNNFWLHQNFTTCSCVFLAQYISFFWCILHDHGPTLHQNEYTWKR